MLQTSENRQDAALSRKRGVPAWALSLGVHAIGLTTLVLVFQRTESPVPSEPTRTAGIVLAKHAEDVAYFSPTEESETEMDSSSLAGRRSKSNATESLETVLPNVSNATSQVNRSPDLPGAQEVAASGSGLLQDVVSSGNGRGTILPGLGDEEILAADPLLNASPQPELGPTAAMKIFGTRSVGRSFVMLIDRSKSMGGEGLGAIEAAQIELARGMQSLTPSQTFQIVAYNQRLSASDSGLITATEQNKRLADRFMRGIVAHGQTEHRMAILAALRNKPEVIYVFTDGGEPTLTQPDLRLITTRASGKTAIHCVQFGFGPLQEEDPFLRKLARLNGGDYAYIDVSRIHRQSQP